MTPGNGGSLSGKSQKAEKLKKPTLHPASFILHPSSFILHPS